MFFATCWACDRSAICYEEPGLKQNVDEQDAQIV